MKISYNWLKKFISLDQSPEELSLLLTGIGLEVEAVDVVQSIPGGLSGMVIGEVMTCQPHPNADRLRITTVNIGQPEVLQIVCGAPNVAAGQKVVVATVGAKLYPIEGEPFDIKKSKIRGEVSEGMICAEDEIGIGQGHDGIMVLPADTAVGMPASQYFKLEDDYVFEIGLTPNRADAASHYGVARDVAAFLRKSIALPTVELQNAANTEYPVVVESTACPRYSSCLIEGVQVGASPDWLKNALSAIGVRSINNIVDATNYVLHGLGQPLHAFDASRIRGGQVIVRQAKAGEIIVTLDEVERKLDEADLVICDQERPLCIAGVFGGIDSGVHEGTQSVFLESAYFDAVSVRKTAKRHGLKTDASFRFERGTDPNMPFYALQYAAALIVQVAGGQVASTFADYYPNPVESFRFEVDCNRVRSLIGKAIPTAEITEIITALGIAIEQEEGEKLNVAVPPYKVDVTREVDVIEEVLRIYGYDKIEMGTQLKASLNVSAKPDPEFLQEQIADLLVANGFYELMTNSLTKESYVEDPDCAVRMLNPLSADLDTMRQHLIYSTLDAVSYNQKRKSADLRFFEFGKSYRIKAEGGYDEQKHLVLALTGRAVQGHWKAKEESHSFFHLKAVVDAILSRLGLRDLKIAELGQGEWGYGLAYLRGDKTMVEFGALSKSALKKADVNGDVFFADFKWDTLLKAIRKHKIVYQEISKFPAVKRDLALLVDQQVSFESLRQIAMKSDRKLLKDVSVFDVYLGDRLPAGKKSYALSFHIQDEEKTLSDKQIDAVISKLITNFEKEAGATVRTQ